MSISQAAVVAKIRDLCGTVDGIAAAYSAADSDDTRIPAGINATPAALVFPGPTVGYTLMHGQHRHTYEVSVQILENGGDAGIRDAVVSVFPDRVLEKLLANVALGGLCNSCVFKRSTGLQGFEYGGYDYTGYELVFEVSEEASAAPAFGS